MGKSIRKLCAIGILALANSAQAYQVFTILPNDEPDIDTYGGFGYKHFWAKPTEHWNPFFRRNYPGFEFFLGMQFNAYTALEVGFEVSVARPEGFPVVAGQSYLGHLATGSGAGEGTVRLKNGYLEFQALYPFAIRTDCDCYAFKLIGAIGVAAARPSFTMEIFGNLITNQGDLTSIHARSRPYFRVGLGAEWDFTEDMGLRAMFRWEDLKRLRGRYGVMEYPTYEQVFKASPSFAISFLFHA